MPYSDLYEDEVEVSKVKRFFLFLLFCLIIGAAFALSSCVSGYSTDGVKKTYVGAVGGKGAAKSAMLALTWDNEKSFNDLAILGLAAVPAVQAVKVAQSADKLSAIEHTNMTKQAINASNNAAATEQLGIKTAADVTKATTLPK